MSTGNLDVNTLAAALTIALKPLQELQEQQLAMMTLNTLYTPQEVQKLRKVYEDLNENKRAVLEEIYNKNQLCIKNLYRTGEELIEARRYLLNDAPGLREQALENVAEFERSNPHFMKAFKIGKVC